MPFTAWRGEAVLPASPLTLSSAFGRCSQRSAVLRPDWMEVRSGVLMMEHAAVGMVLCCALFGLGAYYATTGLVRGR
jgi:hypothetical protein